MYTERDALRVLVIPFDPLSDARAPVHLRIQESIASLTQKAKIPVEVKIGGRRAEDPSSLQLANQRGKECLADLVIYGQYKSFPEDSIRVNLGYSFLNAEGMKSGNLPFQTFQDITEVKVTRDLKDALFSICTMIAVENENWEAAQRWTNKIRNKELREEKMTKWLEDKLQAKEKAE